MLKIVVTDPVLLLALGSCVAIIITAVRRRP